MIEIGKLSVYLRHTDALDKEGIVAAQMAEDLADTRPEAMVRVFGMARRQCKWLPKTVEFLDLYADAAMQLREEEDQARQAAELAEEARMREDRRLHPENYFSIDDMIREAAPRLGMTTTRSLPSPRPAKADVSMTHPDKAVGRCAVCVRHLGKGQFLRCPICDGLICKKTSLGPQCKSLHQALHRVQARKEAQP